MDSYESYAQWIYNQSALEITRAIPLIEKLRHTKKGESEDSEAISCVLWVLKRALTEFRTNVARECEQWFNDSAFK